MKKLVYITVVIIVLLVSLVLFLNYQIKSTAQEKPPQDAEYLIILGAKVNGTELSLSLLYRANKALEYLLENPDTIAIVTGGQGPGEEMTEAEAVRRYLIENGIDTEKILVEDKSTSTYENLENTKKLFDVKEAVIVSNDFHLYRATELAEKVGIKGYPLAAKTPEVVEFTLNVREYAAIIKMYLTGR